MTQLAWTGEKGVYEASQLDGCMPIEQGVDLWDVNEKQFGSDSPEDIKLQMDHLTKLSAHERKAFYIVLYMIHF